MATRTKHQELEEEIGVLRDEVRNIGQKQDTIQEQLNTVHDRLERAKTLETKVDRMESLLLKNDQVQTDIVDYLKRLEGKITHPSPTPNPDPVTPLAKSPVQALAQLQSASKIAVDNMNATS